MRRAMLFLSVLAALPAAAPPGAAIAQPAPPDARRPPPPELVGAPSLVRVGAHRVVLRVRLARPLERRFDGELRASAAIDGRVTSLAPVAGRRGAYCYPARAWVDRARPQRLVAVTVALDGGGAVSALVAIGTPRPADGPAAPPGC